MAGGGQCIEGSGLEKTHTHTHELNVFDGNKTYTGILLEDFTNF